MREYSYIIMIVSTSWTPWPPPVVKLQVFPCNSHWFYAIIWFRPTQSIIFHYLLLNDVQHFGLMILVFSLNNIRTTSLQNSKSFPEGLSQNEKLKTWKRSLLSIFNKISTVQSCVTRVSTNFFVCFFAVSSTQTFWDDCCQLITCEIFFPCLKGVYIVLYHRLK